MPIVAEVARPPPGASGASVTTEVLTDGLMLCTVAVTTPLPLVEIAETYFEATPLSQPQAFANGAVPPVWYTSVSVKPFCSVFIGTPLSLVIGRFDDATRTSFASPMPCTEAQH